MKALSPMIFDCHCCEFADLLVNAKLLRSKSKNDGSLHKSRSNKHTFSLDPFPNPDIYSPALAFPSSYSQIGYFKQTLRRLILSISVHHM